ncbi:hypothetical protein CDIK_2262 [Cucumispora dikerogammari]|nr:hypothetical protein CDIK_2262 [Cucumispora dikerogammari]
MKLPINNLNEIPTNIKQKKTTTLSSTLTNYISSLHDSNLKLTDIYTNLNTLNTKINHINKIQKSYTLTDNATNSNNNNIMNINIINVTKQGMEMCIEIEKVINLISTYNDDIIMGKVNINNMDEVKEICKGNHIIKNIMVFINILKYHKNKANNKGNMADNTNNKKKLLSDNINSEKDIQSYIKRNPLSHTNINTLLYLINISIVLKSHLYINNPIINSENNNEFDNSNLTNNPNNFNNINNPNNINSMNINSININTQYPKITHVINIIQTIVDDFLLFFVYNKLSGFLKLFNNSRYLYDLDSNDNINYNTSVNNKSKKDSGGLTYLISLLDVLDEAYNLKVNEKNVNKYNNVKFSGLKYGIYFNYFGFYTFYPEIITSDNIYTEKNLCIDVRDTPNTLLYYKKVHLKQNIISITLNILIKELKTLTFKEIIAIIKTVQGFKLSKMLRLVYLYEIHQYLRDVMVKNIKDNEVLGLFEFNRVYKLVIKEGDFITSKKTISIPLSGNSDKEFTENKSGDTYIHHREGTVNASSLIYTHPLISPKTYTALLSRYSTLTSTKLTTWFSTILTSLINRYTSFTPITSHTTDNLLILPEFISISNIIIEQLTPTLFDIKIYETISNLVYECVKVFQHDLFQVFEKNIFGKNLTKTHNKNNNDLLNLLYNNTSSNNNNNEIYLIGISNSALQISTHIMKTLKKDSFETQLISDIFINISNKCVDYLGLNIISLFYKPKNLIFEGEILPSFIIKENKKNFSLINKLPPTLKDFFNDYIEILHSDLFDKLFLIVSELIDDLYYDQLLCYISNKNFSKDTVVDTLTDDIEILDTIFPTNITMIRELLVSQSVEIRVIILRNVVKRFKIRKILEMYFNNEVGVFEREGLI